MIHATGNPFRILHTNVVDIHAELLVNVFDVFFGQGSTNLFQLHIVLVRQASTNG